MQEQNLILPPLRPLRIYQRAEAPTRVSLLFDGMTTVPPSVWPPLPSLPLFVVGVP